MAIERKWVEKFYGECGREVSLAYNVLNHTNNWGVTLATGIIAIVFINAVRLKNGEVTLTYPTTTYWFIVIVAWVIMCRFFVRSCLALANMYRWNILIYAASKILSLPEGHEASALFERNFAKKVKAYFYEWSSPIPQKKLVWDSLKLMYLWFFLILLIPLLWGFVELDKDGLWVAGLFLFLIPTLWEIRSFTTWYGLQHQEVKLEAEPEITQLWQGEPEIIETSNKGHAR